MPRKYALSLLALLCAAVMAVCLFLPRTRTVTSSCQAFLQSELTQITLRPTVDYPACATLTLTADHETRTLQILSTDGTPKIALNGAIFTLTSPHPLPHIPTRL